MIYFNFKTLHILSKSKLIILLMCIAIMVYSCKKAEEKPEDVIIEKSMEDFSKEEVVLETKLEIGCYTYKDKSNLINLEITKTDNPVEGNLTFALEEQDKNSGTFKGEFKERILFGTYIFQSEGRKNTRDLIFMLKGDQLIEGNGGLNKSGTKFNEAKKVIYNSKMPLTKTDCIR